MKKIFMLAAALCVMLCAGTASAHMLWVNAYKSETHFPNHVTTHIGYGHALPMDDFLMAGKENIVMQDYFLADPASERHDLRLAKEERPKPEDLCQGMKFQAGNLSINKITLSDEAKQGTYQVVVNAKPNYFTIYKDKSGKKKTTLKSMDRIKDLKTPLSSIRYSANGKTFFTVGKWTQPEPLGFDLELIPLTDLTNVRAGDLVRFRVLLNGKPLSSSYKGIESISAVSPSFGGPDHFTLNSKLYRGEAQFRIPAAGQWVVKSRTVKKINESPAFAKEKGKTMAMYFMSTVTFTAKP